MNLTGNSQSIMRTILFILQKEFIQIIRNRTMLPMIIVLPFVQLLILVNAATFDMKNIEIYVADKDMSATSRELTDKFRGSPFYNMVDYSHSIEKGKEKLLENEADMILNIPEGFEHDLMNENHANIQMLINAINGNAAGLINA